MKALLYLWQLPQHIMALILIALLRGKREIRYNKEIYRVSGNFAVSLGIYTLVSNHWHMTENLVKHEYGHSRQSILLGPLYLIIVGIPSLTFNRISHFNKRFRKNYYNRFPENWADKLGGVNR